MPSTRSGSRTRNIRPQRSGGPTRATPTPSQTETSASEVEIPSRHTRTTSRRRQPNTVTEDDEDLLVPRRLSAVSKHTTRRLHVRPSLTGPLIGEMSIERRAELVADVAGDCLVKLLKSGMSGDERSRSRALDLDWRKAWDGLQSKLHSGHS
jgi:hypothetical protein